MHKTQEMNITGNTKLITTNELREVLHSGKDTAVKIGKEAGAEVRIGRRVLWNLPKINLYINSISE